jgi:NTP pyrophosphatase (non-canonical NTP hydrolase)
MQIGEFQKLIERTYYDRDAARGMGGTFMWFTEEVGELATALRENDRKAMEAEFADVLAWLCTLASLAGISMEEAIKKYKDGCPRCHRMPCDCSQKV